MHSIKNTFTAYLVKAIKNTKINYSNKKKHLNERMGLFDPTQMELITDAGNQRAESTSGAICQDGISDDIATDCQQFVQDKNLFRLFKRLTRREQDIVWRRIFFKQSFVDIGSVHNLTENQAKHVYYYAISKMRRFADGI